MKNTHKTSNLQQLAREVHNRIVFLDSLVKERESYLKKLPQGLVRAVSHGRKHQYYLRKNKQDKNGTYIAKKNLKNIYRMLQREYEESVITSAQKELLLLRRLEKQYSNNTVETIYTKLPSGKQSAILPAIEPDEQFIEQWLSKASLAAESLPFYDNESEFYTARGEHVRSKSEVIIANLLDNLHIPYIYELPLTLKDYTCVHPDFTILDVKTRRVFYWEHLGMMDNPEYLTHALSKIKMYEDSGYYIGHTLILTYETSTHPLSIKQTEQKIRQLMSIEE